MEQVNTLSSSLVLLLAPGLPLLLAVSLMSGAMSRAALVLAPWAALPAFLISLFLSPDMILKLPWLLLGTHLGFDETARMFLMFTALVWLTAGVYSMGYFKDSLARARFLTWFLLAMTGNFGLILAQVCSGDL
jgi:formate hydrogenlyase subunit 3/multisubunit Na+/H+ antiporter MnhD subunit